MDFCWISHRLRSDVEVTSPYTVDLDGDISLPMTARFNIAVIPNPPVTFSSIYDEFFIPAIVIRAA